MLAELMTHNKEWIVTYHEHDSLLENVVEQELNEEEKKAAWEDYEDEKKGISKGNPPNTCHILYTCLIKSAKKVKQ